MDRILGLAVELVPPFFGFGFAIFLEKIHKHWKGMKTIDATFKGEWYSTWQTNEAAGPAWVRDRLTIRRNADQLHINEIECFNANYKWKASAKVFNQRYLYGTWESDHGPDVYKGALILWRYWDPNKDNLPLLIGFFLGPARTGGVTFGSWIAVRKPDNSNVTQSEIDGRLERGKAVLKRAGPSLVEIFSERPSD
jgi:hypothetical protein